ncbi:MAG: alpha/beta hydrolase, partial [Gammaproteobacteria bacterium]|nr:alpha/beta hydrolase [Gammaproteobacteria bacterium]
LTFFWGTCFLVSSISTALYYFGGQPNLLWMIKIIPTAMLVLAILLTIVFPDLYKARRMRKGGVSSIAGISEVKKVALGNVTIGYRTLGKGPLLILLNGSHMNMHHWSPEFLKRLSAYYQVLIFDYPGIGHSSYENMPFTAEKIATCLKRFIEKLNLTPFVMVGYSMGGKIAQVFANHYPKHLRALVLIGTDFGGPKIIQCGEHAREVVTSIGEDVTELQAYLPLFFPESVLPRVEHKMEQIVLSASLEGAPSKEMLEKEGELSARFSADDSNRKALNHLLVPTLIVSGALDELIPTENASLLSETISGAHLMEYPDAGHGVVYQYPLEVADYIHNFLSTMQQY